MELLLSLVWLAIGVAAFLLFYANRIGRVAELADTPQTRGMIAKVAHLVEVVEKE